MDFNGTHRLFKRLPGVEPGPWHQPSLVFGMENTSVNAVARWAVYEDEVYFVTALVPSDTACLASSPGRARRTAV